LLEPYGSLEQRMPLGRVKPAPGGPLGSYLSTVPVDEKGKREHARLACRETRKACFNVRNGVYLV
jgi:hypothetical protein